MILQGFLNVFYLIHDVQILLGHCWVANIVSTSSITKAENDLRRFSMFNIFQKMRYVQLRTYGKYWFRFHNFDIIWISSYARSAEGVPLSLIRDHTYPFWGYPQARLSRTTIIIFPVPSRAHVQLLVNQHLESLWTSTMGPSVDTFHVDWDLSCCFPKLITSAQMLATVSASYIDSFSTADGKGVASNISMLEWWFNKFSFRHWQSHPSLKICVRRLRFKQLLSAKFHHVVFLSYEFSGGNDFVTMLLCSVKNGRRGFSPCLVSQEMMLQNRNWSFCHHSF